MKMMTESVLFVDDEELVRRGYRRRLIEQFRLETAADAFEGLAKLETMGPFAVVVSDFRMPGMNGIEFLLQVKEKFPDTVRIMLTGYADMQMAIDAVNEGNIFRFLTKPCSAETLASALSAGIAQYRLVIAERELLNKTLKGSIQVLSEILSLVSPDAFSRTTRIRRTVRHLAQAIHTTHLWHFELAAMLSHIGCVAIPPAILQKVQHGEPLNPNEQRMYASHPIAGRDLLAKIPRLELITRIIEHQRKPPPLQCDPSELSSAEDVVALGAQILKLAIEFDRLEQQGMSYRDIVLALRKRTDEFHPRLLAALHTIPGAEGALNIREVSVTELKEGMVVEEDILAKTGLRLVGKGQVITLPILFRLRNYAKGVGIKEPVLVRTAAAENSPAPPR